MKMYILVLNDVPLGHAINCAAHAAVGCTLKYQSTFEVQEWLRSSFKKVTCKVNKHELAKAMEVHTEYFEVHERNLDKLTAVAFKPATKFHKCFNFLSLYK